MKLETFAKKTFLALKNPYQSVMKVRPLIIDDAANLLKHEQAVYYVGVKNTSVIPTALVSKLEEQGFLWHTTDTMALGGRAVDISLMNPLTTKPMTGSSSGTALNVLYGINDLGIGSDGGGSVLAPACAVNLFGFISPLFTSLYQSHSKSKKTSTDGISFTPSIGFLSRTFDIMHTAISTALPLPKQSNSEQQVSILMPKEAPNPFVDISRIAAKLENKLEIRLVQQSFPDIYDNREALIRFLSETVKPNTILVSFEGPVDQYGLGDTVFGHFDDATKTKQRNGYKGLLRVANMANKSALIIPDERLGVGILLICESTVDQIEAMLCIASTLTSSRSHLLEAYMMNTDHHFAKEFREE